MATEHEVVDPAVVMLQLAGFTYGRRTDDSAAWRIYRDGKSPFLACSHSVWKWGKIARTYLYIPSDWGLFTGPAIPMELALKLIETTYGN